MAAVTSGYSTQARNIRELQPAVYAKGEGGMKIEKEDEGKKQRRVKVWGGVHFYELVPLSFLVTQT